MRTPYAFVALTLTSLLAIAACGKGGDAGTAPLGAPAGAPAAAGTPLEAARAVASNFAPLSDGWAKEGQTKAQEDLGRMLYFETRISKNHDLSCNSCHQLDNFGVDGEPTSPGHKGQRGGRNSPTVFNAAGHFTQFWDGREPHVEAQAKGPVLNPIEMAMPDAATVVKTLKSIPGYPEAFKAAFPSAADAVTYDNFAAAVGAFERKLATPSRFDAFLKGDDTALSEVELKGMHLFVTNGCTTCHNGELVGGTSFEKVGAVKPWPNQKDLGRHDVTKADDDKLKFKAPSLRNVAKTGPYFHDGSIADLGTAVKMMAAHQLGRELSDDDAAAIVAFLGALTGEVDEAYVAKPQLPPSGPDTPKPDPS